MDEKTKKAASRALRRKGLGYHKGAGVPGVSHTGGSLAWWKNSPSKPKRPKVKIERFQKLPYDPDFKYSDRYKFKVRSGSTGKAAEGLLAYDPVFKEVTGDIVVSPESRTGRARTSKNIKEIHAVERGRVFSPGETRKVLRGVARKFPEADTLRGFRITGAKQHLVQRTGMQSTGMQEFDLNKVRMEQQRRISRIRGKGKLAKKIAGRTVGKLIPGIGLALTALDAYDAAKWAAGRYKREQAKTKQRIRHAFGGEI